MLQKFRHSLFLVTAWAAAVAPPGQGDLTPKNWLFFRAHVRKYAAVCSRNA